MITLKPVILEYGGFICRRCMNRRYGVHLAHRDCKHADHPQHCPCCRKDERLVTGLRLPGLVKMWGK